MNFEEQCYLGASYTIEFAARVREAAPVEKGLTAVYLDRTFFYPESGGQPMDKGTLGGLEVAGVSEDEKGVRHLVKGELRVGADVAGRIDWTRRFDHMQQHTGQHLLSRVFLGHHKLRTVSFHLGEETCTIDLEGTVPRPDTLEAAEARANALVMENLPVTCRVVGAKDFEAGNVVRSRLPEGVDRVRIVDIGEFDSATCCGTHVRATGEIGPIKILGMEKIKGNARVEFVCGGRAVKDYAAKHAVLAAVASLFSTDWREIPRVVEKLSEESRALKKRGDELSRELAVYRAAGLAKATSTVGGFDIVKRLFDDGDAASLRETATKIREMGGKIVLFGLTGASPALVFACSAGIAVNMGEILKASAAVIGARGGGVKDFAQGGGGDGARVGEALDDAERRVREALG